MFMPFLLLIYLCQLNSQAPLKESKKEEGKFSLPYTALGMSLCFGNAREHV